MRVRSFTWGFGVMALILCVQAAALADDVELVTPQDGTTYQLAPEEVSWVTVPLDLADDIVAADVTVELLRVRLGSTQNAVADTAFLASYKPAPPTLTIDVKLDQAPEAGTYNLAFLVTHDDATQRLELQLERPAATLDAPDRIEVERTRKWPWADLDEDKPVLRLIERAGTRVSRVVVRQLDAAVGGVTFRSPPLKVGDAYTGVIKPDGEAVVPYDLEDVGTGTETRTVEVLSPQLEQPIEITFEIVTRWHWGWIVVWGALGLVAGAALRTWSRTFIELRNQRIPALELERCLAEEKRLHADAVFHKAVDGLILRMEKLRQDEDGKWKQPDGIEGEVADVKAELQKALTDLSERRTKVAAEIDELRNATSTPWRVPENVRASMRKAAVSVRRADTLLARDAVGDLDGLVPDGAAKAIIDAKRVLSETVREAIRNWVPSVVDDLSRLAARATLDVPVSLLEAAKISAQAVTSLEQLRADKRTDAAALLEAFDAAIEGLHAVAARTGGVLDGIDQAREMLVDHDVDFGTWDECRKNLQKVLEVLADVNAEAIHQEAALQRFAGLVLDLLQSVELVLRGAAAEVDIAEPLKRLDYAGAAALIPEPRMVDERLSDEEKAGTAATRYVREGSIALAEPPRPRRESSRTLLSRRAALLPIDTALAMTRNEIRRATLVRTLFAIAVFLLTAIPVFKADFVGDFDDILKILLWAFAADFATDFGVERVVALATAGGAAATARVVTTSHEVEEEPPPQPEDTAPEDDSEDSEDTPPENTVPDSGPLSNDAPQGGESGD